MKPEFNKCLHHSLARKNTVNECLTSLQARTTELLHAYFQYTGVTQEELDRAFPYNSSEVIVRVPGSAWRSKLIAAGAFYYAAMLRSYALEYLFVEEDMSVECMVDWGVNFGCLRGMMDSATNIAESGSSGGRSRAQTYEKEYLAIIAKCDVLFPNWRVGNKPSADKMAEEMIGMFEVSHRAMASAIRNARKMHRAAHTAQTTEQIARDA